jgi:CrcB protein
MQLLAIAAGGATGSILRFLISTGMHNWLGRAFPYGTLAVNVLGSLLIGFLFILITSLEGISPLWRSLLMVGFLGSLTTFSTFSLETLELLERTEFVKALLNIGLNVSICLAATWLGVVLGKSVVQI